MEPSLMESRPPSSASSSTHDDDEDYTGDIWNELDSVFQAEDDFVGQEENALQDTPEILFDNPATSVTRSSNTTTSPNVSLLRQSIVIGPSSPSPTPSPSQLGTRVASQSASTGVARASPSRRFFASPDQIDDLGTPRTWIHSGVISTLGETFCFTSRSKPRNQHYEILPTHLFDLWDANDQHKSIFYHFKRAVSPLECRAWLIPVLLNKHWYLLVLDWIDCQIHIYDSLAAIKTAHPCLVTFGVAILN